MEKKQSSMRTVIRTTFITSLLWLLAIGYGSLYALFNGVEIRLPAPVETAQQKAPLAKTAQQTLDIFEAGERDRGKL